LFLLAILIPSFVQANIPNSNHNSRVSTNGTPYQVLGVEKNASSEEIKRRYRQLCLKYHPDKNVNLSEKERDLAEETFKQVQAANTQIGKPDARKTYDSQQSLFGSGMPMPGFSQQQSGASNQSFEQAFAQAFRAARPGYSSQGSFGRSTPFYGSNLFSRTSRPAGFSSPILSSLNSVYVQKVPVSLADLYAGKQGVEVTLTDTIWKRYAASFRGGVAYILLYQAVLYSIPTFKLRLKGMMSVWFAALVGGVVFHVHLPRPTIAHYTFDLKAGFKEGTKLIFKDAEPGLEVVFVLVPGEKHCAFTRVGNDLHVTVPISSDEMIEGCTIDIEPLDPEEPTIEVDVPPGVIERSGETLTVKGKGWPIRKLGTHGDLIVHFTLTTIRRRRWHHQTTKKRRWRLW
jgi:DnaJ-class molecular chaperone